MKKYHFYIFAIAIVAIGGSCFNTCGGYSSGIGCNDIFVDRINAYFAEVELSYDYNKFDTSDQLYWSMFMPINASNTPINWLNEVFNNFSLNGNGKASLAHTISTEGIGCYGKITWEAKSEADVVGNTLMNVPYAGDYDGRLEVTTVLRSVESNGAFPHRIVWTARNNRHNAMVFKEHGEITTCYGVYQTAYGTYKPTNSGPVSGQVGTNPDHKDPSEEEDYDYFDDGEDDLGCGGDQYHYDEETEEYVPIENTYIEGTIIPEASEPCDDFVPINEFIPTLMGRPVYINGEFTTLKTWQTPYSRFILSNTNH